MVRRKPGSRSRPIVRDLVEATIERVLRDERLRDHPALPAMWADRDLIADEMMDLYPSELGRRRTQRRLGVYRESSNDTAGVYVVRSGELVKIGRTVNRRQRMGALRTGSGHPLEELAWIPADSAEDAANLELHLHQRFASARTTGEWFRFTDEIAAWVASLPREDA